MRRAKSDLNAPRAFLNIQKGGGKFVKSWLKYLIAGLCILAVVGATIGIVVGVRNKDEKSDSLAKHSEVYFDDAHALGETSAWFSAYAVGEKQFTKITYQIDTNPEVQIENSVYDVVSEDWIEYDSDFDGMNYIDTTRETIDLSDLEAGKHVIQVFVYAGSTARECICEKIFTIQ